MASTVKYIMCCSKEVKFRIKNRLVHVMETEDPSSSTKKPVRLKMVKEYSRCAAAQNLLSRFKVRGFQELLTTIEYLLSVVTNASEHWELVYDFVADRLRAVRQDITIGRMDDLKQMQLLELMLPFYFESIARSEETNCKTYDRKLHMTQLEECTSKWKILHDKFGSHNNTIICCYLLHNCAKSWSLQLCYKWKEDLPVDLWNDVASLLLDFKMRNAVGFFRVWKRLDSATMRSAIFPMLAKLRRDFIIAVSLSYRGRNLTLPVTVLGDWIQITPRNDLLILLNEHLILTEEPNEEICFFGSRLRS